MKVNDLLKMLQANGWVLVATRRSHPAEQAEIEIREAIILHIDGLREDGIPVPPALSKVEYVEVAA